MKRIFLFVATNIAIMVTLMTVLSLLGFTGYLTADGLDYVALGMFSLVWGFGGAFISLAMSRWMAKTAMGVQLVEGQPADARSRYLRLAGSERLRDRPEQALQPRRGVERADALDEA
jgi:heat shock protein HtpX